jgi:hemerythrin
MNLHKHTSQYFDTEEQHMKAIGYPKLEQHRELHNGLITGLNNLIEKPINTNLGLEGLKKFVYNWIIDHILNHDKKYFEFYQEQARPIAAGTASDRRGRPRKYEKSRDA